MELVVSVAAICVTIISGFVGIYSSIMQRLTKIETKLEALNRISDRVYQLETASEVMHGELLHLASRLTRMEELYTHE